VNLIAAFLFFAGGRLGRCRRSFCGGVGRRARHVVPRPGGGIGEGVGRRLRVFAGRCSAEGGHGRQRGALHLQALDGHLQHAEVHLEPTLDGLEIGDALVEFIHVQRRRHHAGQGEAHAVPHLLDRFQRILSRFVGHGSLHC
jgi:hypothetical protein